MILRIASENDRRIVAGIMVMNGYTVKSAKTQYDGKVRSALSVTEPTDKMKKDEVTE